MFRKRSCLRYPHNCQWYMFDEYDPGCLVFEDWIKLVHRWHITTPDRYSFLMFAIQKTDLSLFWYMITFRVYNWTLFSCADKDSSPRVHGYLSGSTGLCLNPIYKEHMPVIEACHICASEMQNNRC